MGMLENGKWSNQTDQRIIDGEFKRELSKFDAPITAEIQQRLRLHPEDFAIVLSKSCPWSHRVLLTLTLIGLDRYIAVHFATGPRDQGYRLSPHGPLDKTVTTSPAYVHQLYTLTTPNYTGRSTVPILWDKVENCIVSNDSAVIVKALATLCDRKQPTLYPNHLVEKIDQFNFELHENLANAVYQAGFAQTQDAYDKSVQTVFKTMDNLEKTLCNRRFIFDPVLTISDVYLFCVLVRFDAVYFTHFRCSYKRLVDYPALWKYARRIFQLPGIRSTVDFQAISEGYYCNDGDNNPHKIIGILPHSHWHDVPST